MYSLYVAWSVEKKTVRGIRANTRRYVPSLPLISRRTYREDSRIGRDDFASEGASTKQLSTADDEGQNQGASDGENRDCGRYEETHFGDEGEEDQIETGCRGCRGLHHGMYEIYRETERDQQPDRLTEKQGQVGQRCVLFE